MGRVRDNFPLGGVAVDMSEIPLLGMLRERMSWLNQRQSVLSQNVANADAPGYTARDLKGLDFESLLRRASGGSEFSGQLTATNPRHIAVSASGAGGFDTYDSPDVGASTGGNTVSLEEEMMKVADTQAQYQAAANLYSKAIGLLRTAIGKGGE